MKIIGITGGIGAGKSTILSILKQEYQAHVLEADQAAHLLMQPGQSAYKRIVTAFTTDILDADGTIQRGKMAELVFQNPSKLEQLNQIVHPEVKRYIWGEIETCRSGGETQIFVIEAALLIEDGYTEICDELWYVYAPEELRIQRLMESRGYSREKCENIMKNQSSDGFYRRHCNRVIRNDASYKDIKKQVEELLKNPS